MKPKKYKNSLVVGAGSGRDIASAILIANKLIRNGSKVDLAGFLTPWSLHTFNQKIEKPINKLTNSNSKKFSPINPNKHIKHYFEPHLFTLNNKLSLNINNFYLFSLQYGISKLKNNITNLLKKNNYDYIVIVDVGGDILTTKKELPTILTPIIDISCLQIFADIKTNSKIEIAIISPGSDGEMNPSQLKTIINKLKVKKTQEIKTNSQEYKLFIKLNNEISKQTTSKSNTTRLIHKTLTQNSSKTYKQDLIKYITIFDKILKIKFPIKLDPKLVRQIYYFDIKEIDKKCKYRFTYKNIFEAYKQIFEFGAQSTEIDLAFLPTKNITKSYELIYTLNPGKHIDEKKRKKIITLFLDKLKTRKIKNKLNKFNILLKKEDLNSINILDFKIKKELKNFLILEPKTNKETNKEINKFY